MRNFQLYVLHSARTITESRGKREKRENGKERHRRLYFFLLRRRFFSLSSVSGTSNTSSALQLPDLIKRRPVVCSLFFLFSLVSYSHTFLSSKLSQPTFFSLFFFLPSFASSWIGCPLTHLPSIQYESLLGSSVKNVAGNNNNEAQCSSVNILFLLLSSQFSRR